MTLNRILALTSVALSALLVTQVVVKNNQPPPSRWHASWVNNANTAKEGVDQSDHVIQAKVIGLEKGQDIVIPAPLEPDPCPPPAVGTCVVIPTTIVKLEVTKSYKGGKVVGDPVTLVQTGGGSDALQLPTPPEADQVDKSPGPPKGKAKQARPGDPSSPTPSGPTSKESRAVILEDDPPYGIGEKYILFLKNIDEGPAIPKGALAAPPGAVRALAPEGRYQVTKQDHLKPATTKKGFAPKWQGKHISELEAAILAP